MLNRSDLTSISPKWGDRSWALGQLRSHLFEVGFLLEKEDPHFEMELVDLALIASYLADPELVEVRLAKFREKARLHHEEMDAFGRQNSQQGK